ncbi:MAG: ABC transporter substrate-binding protein [Acidimicrobiales bacterium]
MPRSAWRLAALGVLVVLALVAVGCTDDEPSPTERADGPLAGVCPDPLVIQTDWYPEAEHGSVYHLLDRDDIRIETDTMRVTAPMVASGEPMGVDLQVRAGGPAIGFSQVAAQMHADPDILLGLVGTDEAIQTNSRFPTVAVVAPLEINPQMIMWDPETYDVETIAELPDDTVINVFGPDAHLDHLVDRGIVDRDQLDGGYTGTPARFVAADGTIAQQGFATADPYSYEHLIDEWGRPVRFQLIHDTGWEVYAQALAARPDAIDDHADCLDELVPAIQQAIVGYVTEPSATNALIADLADRYGDEWVYEEELADWSVDQQRSLGIVGNGSDDTVGNFDLERVQGVLDTAAPVMEIGHDLTPQDLVTNRFIDPGIRLPSG